MDENRTTTNNYTSTKPNTKQSTNKKKKNTIDIPTIIFFAIMIIGLIIFTIILLKKPTSKIYYKDYGNNITMLVEFYNKSNDIDIAVDVDNNRSLQKGTYEKTKKENAYLATFTENNTEMKVNISIKDKEMTLIFDDGTEIILEEKADD